MSRASDAGIAVRDLSKGYGEGPVLDGLSFDLPSGETLSVIGQRQRVAIGRALITDPDILLMDEPFSSLDALTREHLQTTVLSLWQRRRPTCVLVTHNVPEAVFLGKHVMVMNGHPARNVMWLENPCFGDADPRGEERYFSLTKKVYAALSETKDFSCPH